MAVKFSLSLESAVNFPPPSILANPKFRLNLLSIRNQLGNNNEHCIFTKNGRGALAIAGEALKRDTENVILVPAYHCPALVEPFIWLDYQIRFYPVTDNLSIDLEVLEECLSSNVVTHCILVRYFGFNQNIEEVISALKQHNISIIEDCAHAFFAFQHKLQTNSCRSDAQICSINKLLPSIDGGGLHMPKHALPELRPRGIMSEIKGILHTLGISQRLLKLKPSRATLPAKEDVKPASDVFRYFVPEEKYNASYRHTKLMAQYSQLDEIAKIRRSNFEYIVSHIQNCSAGSPLYTKLTSEEVPYVLPFILNDASDFKKLRMLGIQALRWEEIAESTCVTSNTYREKLVQLPCHHQMSKCQMDKLIQSIKQLG